MRYAVVRIGNLDLDCHSWLAGVTSDKELARQLTDKANLSHSFKHEYKVFQIPDEDFISDELKEQVVLGEASAQRQADAYIARRIEIRENAQRRKAKKAAKDVQNTQE